MIQTTSADATINLPTCVDGDPDHRAALIADWEADTATDLRVDAVALDEDTLDVDDRGEWVGWDDHGCDVYAHDVTIVVEIVLEA